MIITETVTIDDKQFTHTYSDTFGYGVQRDGVTYGEAYDPAEYERVYEEVPVPEEQPTAEDYEAAGRILMGDGAND